MPDPTLLASPVARPIVVHVCTSCRAPADGTEGGEPDRPGARLHRELMARQSPEFRVVPVACLGNCNRGCTIALQGPGVSASAPSWTYVFGDLGPGSGAEIEAAARLLGAAPDGLMPWRGRPEAFKRGLIARIPPLAHQDAAE